MESEYEDDLVGSEEYIEVPTCIESLISTTCQIRQLAQQASNYYSKILLCYGCTGGPSSRLSNQPAREQARSCCKSTYIMQQSQKQASKSLKKRDKKTIAIDIEKLIKDNQKLRALESLVSILPLLNELCTFVERCLLTVEAAIRRITYYLEMATRREKRPAIVKHETFELTFDVRLDTVFISLMDLIFALISLDRTLCDHTSIQDDLNLLDSICQTLVSDPECDITNQDQDSTDLNRDNLSSLNEYLKNIKLTLGSESGTFSSLFSQCLKQVQHLNLSLSKDKTQAGFKYFAQLYEEFLIFYSDHVIDISAAQNNLDSAKSSLKIARVVGEILIDTNVIPTIYMNTHSRKILGLVSLIYLYSAIFNRPLNKRVNRSINQAIQRSKCNNLVLLAAGSDHLVLDEFIRSYMSTNNTSIEKKSIDYLAGKFALLLKVDLDSEFDRLSLKSREWVTKLKIEAVDLMHNQSSDWPRKQILLLDYGLKLLDEIITTIGHVVASHQHHNISMNKTNLIGLYRLFALVKSLQTGLAENLETFMTSTLTKLEHFIGLRWCELFQNVQKRQVMMNYTDRKLELIWILKLCEMVSEPEITSTPVGRLTQAICLPMLTVVFNQAELDELNLLMDLLRLDFHDRLASLVDCSQLYWHLSTLSTYYIHAFEELQGATRELNALHVALNDVFRYMFVIAEPKPTWSLVDTVWLTEKCDKYLELLSKELFEQFKVDYLDRVCQELEVELRLQIHKDLYTDDYINPFSRHMYDFKDILESGDGLPIVFRLFNHRISLKHYVEHHLNAVCYNLTAIAPHDWLTYDNMMNLARHKYGLNFVESQLPAQTLDSGLDLLDIIRNLALFASRYSYDLTNQCFLEKCSNRLSTTGSIIQSISSTYAPSSSNQFLNVLQIEHVAQSIQTHGFGILDSAVNCTYQTLKKLINVFSRQLSDEKLRAVLQKEYQQMLIEFKTKQQASHWVISFDRADRMARKFKLSASSLTESISQHNTTSSGQRHRPSIDLDSIRQTVTQLGNLLAFIRLIKSGALNSASRAVDYVPEIEDLASLRLSKCAEEEFQDYATLPMLLDATKNLDQCLADLEDNFLPKTNYSKIIVNLFTNLLSTSRVAPQPQASRPAQDNLDEGSQDAQAGGDITKQCEDVKPTKQTHHHLDLFFLLIPALTINYILYLVNCKERVASRSSMARFGALLCDDGFVFGIAFLLTILNQTGDFSKLDWLKQTCTKIQEDIEQVETLLRDPNYEESLRQTSSMTLRRLKRLHSEYAALDNTLSCALLLFENLTH